MLYGFYSVGLNDKWHCELPSFIRKKSNETQIINNNEKIIIMKPNWTTYIRKKLRTTSDLTTILECSVLCYVVWRDNFVTERKNFGQNVKFDGIPSSTKHKHIHSQSFPFNIKWEQCECVSNHFWQDTKFVVHEMKV